MLNPQKQQVEMTPRRNNFSQTRPYLSVPHSSINVTNDVPHKMDEQIFEEQEHPQISLGDVIYGTNIETQKAMESIANFITNFEVLNSNTSELMEEKENPKIYRQMLEDINFDMIPNNVFEINGEHLKEFDRQIYNQLVHYPAEMVTLFDQVIKSLYEHYYIEPEGNRETNESLQLKKAQIMMGVSKLADVKFMRHLKPKDINHLLSFRGIVVRCSDVYPEMKRAVFRCVNRECNTEVGVNLENAKVEEPKTCPTCNSKHPFEIVHNYCQFTDKQYVKFQQLPENVPEGQTPTSMTIICYDSNVNGMRPGDKVEVVGIYRCQGRKLSRGRSRLQTVYSTYTDLISFKIMEENKFKAESNGPQTMYSAEDKEEFHTLAQNEDIIKILTESFASSIYGHENIKKGLLAQIFGGTHKQFNGRGRFRSDINVCLVGDPSTAKSQLLKQVHNIAPRGIYTSGRGSSAVGLTANVRKDPETKEFVLESGALVLSDLGICCIDEFDKMDENSKLILLESMEQQTISVAKAGIVCQLNSRTSILSAANPINSRYDPKKSVIENIHLPPALLSRFDLIYIILDQPSEVLDKLLAKHILNLYSGKKGQPQKEVTLIPREKLVKYISYAKQYCSPVITQQAGQKLSECYMAMRSQGVSRKIVTATPRQLESLIRMSESFAKMRLSKEVSVDDVEMAYELIKDALKQSATDPVTGLIDMDVIVTGHSSASKKRVETIIKILSDLFKANATDFLNKKVTFDKITEEISKKWSSENQVELKPRDEDTVEAIHRLETSGVVNLFGDRKTKPSLKYLGGLD